MNEIIVCNGAKHYGIDSTISFESILFKCGEPFVRIKDSIRGKDMTIIQGFSLPNTNLMELMFVIDACRRAGCGVVNVILPLLPFSRQDRKHISGVPISAKVICDMLKVMNINRLITLDLHANQIAGFLPNHIQFDHIQMSAFWEYHLSRSYGDMREWCFVAPDAGAIKRTNGLSTQCESGNVCFINKVREKAGVVKDMTVIGNVNGKKCVLTDDMIDSGGTITKAVNELYKNGATNVIAVATHGILSGNAYKNLRDINVMVSDSCDVKLVSDEGDVIPSTMDVIPLKSFLMDICHRIDNNIMLGSLFTGWNE